MEKLSIRLTNKFIERGIVEKKDREIYKTGLDLIIADIINFSLIIAAGIIAGDFISSCLYIVTFWSIRKYSGGFHAKSYGVCRVVTVGVFLGVVAAKELITSHLMIYTITFDIITLLTMFWFAPVKHPNKELTETEKKANRLFAILSTSLFCLASVVLSALKIEWGFVISLNLLAIAVLMYVGMAVNFRKEEQRHEINR